MKQTLPLCCGHDKTLEHEYATNECVVCEQVITNPICPDCLSVQMKTWVAETNPQLAKEIDGFNLPGDTNCLFCGESMSICAHCYSKDVYEQLKEKDSQLAQEFVARFDFELRRAVLG